MSQYNFANLSPYEFENLTRDLLQKEKDVTFESFKTGKDGGIDFRYAKSSNSHYVVQCKRYTDNFEILYRHLKNEELPKVKVFKPTAYILVTSCGLTPANKDRIIRLFKPYISSTADIYGQDDLNNLLQKFPDIERQNFKLWLSSVNIMQSILNADVINRTLFEKDEINDTLTTYVQNESFNDALKVFHRHKFIVISGAPGIGKTTLARILIYNELALNHFEEFIYINRGIEQAYKLYNPLKKQLFFFDDFLGKNYFEKGFERNEENDLIGFIKKVTSSPNKGLIFTTREYILRQAQSQYEELNKQVFKMNTYVIELEKYTKLIRAQILYNHLFKNGLPLSHLSEFLDQAVYIKLIEHANYSPRLIETVLEEKPWVYIQPKDFPSAILGYFDNPSSLWEHAYTKGLSNHARLVLKILFTIPTPAILDNIYKIFINNFKDTGNIPEHFEFESAVKELENTFIKLKTSGTISANLELVVDFKNPSVIDFLYEKYSKGNIEDIFRVSENPVFIDQLVYRFTGTKEPVAQKIKITNIEQKNLRELILHGAADLPFTGKDSVSYSSFSSTISRITTRDNAIYYLLNEFDFVDDDEIKNILFESFLLTCENQWCSFSYLWNLITFYEKYFEIKHVPIILQALVDACEDPEELSNAIGLEVGKLSSEEVSKWVNDKVNWETIQDKAYEVLSHELDTYDPVQLEEARADPNWDHWIAESFDLDDDIVNDMVEHRFNQALEDAMADTYDGEYVGYRSVDSPSNDNREIVGMFESLR